MFSKDDVRILRKYAARVRALADDPRNDLLREMWRDHTSLNRTRPLIFVSPEGAWNEILPESALQCQGSAARNLERALRRRIIRRDLIRDDVPTERTFFIERAHIPINEGWGITPRRIESESNRGAWRYDPVIEKPSDWKPLKMPTLHVDERGVHDHFSTVSEAIGDLLDVRLVGLKNFSFHMMHLYCDFRGLTNTMMDLYEEPEMVHDVISFFTEGFQRLIDQLRENNLIDLNNDGQYHYTGGLGYTRDLPKPGFDPRSVRTIDVWGAAEAQEFAQVSPAMHETFILQYERKLLANFGLNGYGCCDDLTHKLVNVKKIANLRRVGISPWSDVEKCADQLGKDYIMAWKPQPSYLAEETYRHEEIQTYLAESLRKGAHSRMEIILRDTHTCRSKPERFTAFVKAARSAIDSVHGPSETGWLFDDP